MKNRNKLVNKAFIINDKTQQREMYYSDIPIPMPEMHKEIRENKKGYRVGRMWSGVAGQSNLGEIRETESEFVKTLMTKGGIKKSGEILKAMVYNG
jgi:hypothetical protein